MPENPAPILDCSNEDLFHLLSGRFLIRERISSFCRLTPSHRTCSQYKLKYNLDAVICLMLQMVVVNIKVICQS